MKLNSRSETWRKFPARQQPIWPDPASAKRVSDEINTLPELVLAGETRRLKQALEGAEQGKAFVLQCGDCAEQFAYCNSARISRMLDIITKMSALITHFGKTEVIQIGRIAGQYAKPRSYDFEKLGGEEISVYRGDIINSHELNRQSRTPDPQRMREAYFRSAATINYIRALSSEGNITRDEQRDIIEKLLSSTRKIPALKQIADKLESESSSEFIQNETAGQVEIKGPTLYMSHEALLLEYEAAMTRVDGYTNKSYNTSAHMVWIGERTRGLHEAHIEYASSIENPVGIKIGPECSIEELELTIRKINPRNERGKIILISRMGSENIGAILPGMIRYVKQRGLNALWCSDPMHGNTYITEHGIKTRDFKRILSELNQFFDIHRSLGTTPSGVHLELAGEEVTECVGGAIGTNESDLRANYQSTCDPRLCPDQAVELSLELARLMASKV
jgi:3-deoxy-7-phosphoheptulonate synthase